MRISTTTLESFRLFMQPDQTWMPEQELIDTIRGKFVPTHRVLLGQAFGAVIEAPDRYRVAGGYRLQPRGGDETFFFRDDVMAPAFALIDRPNTVFEAKGIKRYFDRHDVVAKADQLCGAHLVETKATLGTFNFEKYAASYQWRFMTDIFQPAKITYRIFCLDEDRHGIELRSVESFDLFPYAECHNDCRRLLAEFLEYVTARGLLDVLEQRQADAPAEL